MEIIYHRLFKVDIIKQEVSLLEFVDNANVNTYIMELLQNVSDNEGDREYIFEDGSLTMKTYLNQFVNSEGRDITSKKIAFRLLQEETKAQEKIAHLNIQIHKGVLIISYVQMTETENKIIVSKADYNEFIEELSGSLSSGLPTKKKIFKAFIANISNDGQNETITKLVTFDSNTTKASYWVKNFLELSEVRDDQTNTIIAFDAIKKDILNPLKNRQEYKRDYLCLWNATIAYFRGEGDFDIAHYRDAIIGNYQPMEKTLDIKKLKNKITLLPDKYEFDNIFTKKPNVVKDRFKNIIKLSDEMDLIIKQDVANPKKTFIAYEDKEGRKYIAILSDEGFQYADQQ